jgi:feruloyl esterase
MIPGMGHCAGGSGPNDFDYLSYLEHWIEDGHAPDKIVGTHIDFDRFVQAHESETNSDQEKLEAELRAYVQDPSNRSFSRPVYLYPAYAKFKGEGDPNSEGSFVASEGK